METMSADLAPPPPAAAQAQAPATGSTAEPATILSGAASTPPAQASPDWKASLPGIFKDPSLLAFQGFETQAEMVENLGKSYLETKKMVGVKLSPPHEGSTPEDVAKWRKTVGAPETPEGYGETLRPEGIPEQQWDTGTEKEFRAIAHKHHLTPAAVKEIMEFYGGTVTKGLEQFQAGEAAYVDQQITTLKTDWGQQYDRNLSLAKRFAITLGLDPTDSAFNSAAMVKAMARGAQLISESSLKTGDSTGINGSVSNRIQEIIDPTSTTLLSRQYRGEMGAAQQQEAQAILHNLYKSQNAT